MIVIVHGFNAHSGQYIFVAEQLLAQNFAVYALDLRGRGHSDGERFPRQNFDLSRTIVGPAIVVKLKRRWVVCSS